MCDVGGVQIRFGERVTVWGIHCCCSDRIWFFFLISDVVVQWCSQGDLLAVAGLERHSLPADMACISLARNVLVKFYNVHGEHIYTLETPAQVSPSLHPLGRNKYVAWVEKHYYMSSVVHYLPRWCFNKSIYQIKM